MAELVLHILLQELVDCLQVYLMVLATLTAHTSLLMSFETQNRRSVFFLPHLFLQ